MAPACPLLQEAAREALPRRHRAGGHDLGRCQHRFERGAAGLGQRAIVIVRRKPAIGDQDVVGMDAPFCGECTRPGERHGVDITAQKKAILVLDRGRCARNILQVRPLGRMIDHKRHGNTPDTSPFYSLRFWDETQERLRIRSCIARGASENSIKHKDNHYAKYRSSGCRKAALRGFAREAARWVFK